MKLNDFLNLIADEYVKVLFRNVNNVVYEGDKNAIRMNQQGLLDRNVINVGIAGKNKFEVLIG